jgi:hypothetical protein
LITIKTYLPEYKTDLLEIFKSNMPLYFADEEVALFDAFLDRDASTRGPYSIVFNEDKIVGCGGIALNQPTKYTNETARYYDLGHG